MKGTGARDTQRTQVGRREETLREGEGGETEDKRGAEL